MRVPSAEVIDNPIGSAPGWWVDRDGSVTVLMPGVPSEMRLMWAERVVPRLQARFGAPPLSVRTVKTFGVGESAAAERLGSLLTAPPPGVEAGIYARDDGVHVRFTSRNGSAAIDGCVDEALAVLGPDAYGTDEADLAGAALAALAGAGAGTLSTWEADTGGALLALLADVEPTEGAARYVGGLLDTGGASGPPLADAVLQVSLLAADTHGRSRVRVACMGIVSIPRTELRIHGSGPQRSRRAAYAALDLVRRTFSSSAR